MSLSKKQTFYYLPILVGLLIFTWTESVGAAYLTGPQGPWTEAGGAVYYNDSNVGIGTSTPAAKLQINPGSDIEGLRIVTSNYSPFIIRNAANTQDLFRIDQSGNISSLGEITGSNNYWKLSGNNLFASTTTWNLGIGTTTPSQKLDIVGKIALNGMAIAYRPSNLFGTLVLGNGGDSLQNVTGIDGYYNTFVGIDAGFKNTTGNSNTALGDHAFYENTTGFNNTTQGASSLRNNISGSRNTAQGVNALFSNNTGGSNAAQGADALNSNTTGSYNTAQGRQSLHGNTTGSYNTAQGYLAGRYIANGSTANTIGSNSVFLGYDARALADGQTNQIVIGASAIGNGSNSVTLGNDSITKTILKGNVGIGTTAPLRQLEVAGTGRIRLSGSGPDIGFTDNQASGTPWRITNGQAGVGTFAIIDDVSGQYRLAITPSFGNVGIGTTVPGAKLDISGSLRTNNSVTLSALAGTGIRTLTVDPSGVLGSATSTASQWTTTGSNIYYNTGNVGIGTLLPRGKLEVVSGTSNTNADISGLAGDFTSATPSGQGSTVSLESNDAMAINTGGVLGFGGRYITAGTGYANWASIKGLKTDGTSGNYGGYLSFFTRPNGASNAERMRITGNGNVGVGNTNPAQALDVNGVITAVTGYRVNNVAATAGNYLRGNGTNFVASTIQAGDVPTLNQNTSGYSGLLIYEDNRVISPSELAANRLKFGFTAYNNNNTSPYADFLHMRSYQDSSGGSDNLLVFNKSGLGMRLYQQAWGSATAYTTYKDILLVDNTPTVNYLIKYSNSGAIVSARNSLVYDNGSNVGIDTTAPGTKLDISGSLRTNNSVTLSALANGGSRMVTVDNGGVLGATTMPSASQWTTTGSNIYYNTGNVGVGDANPQASLHVETGTSASVRTGLIISNPHKTWTLGNNLPNQYNDIFAIYDGANARLWISGAGNVGIGVNNPSYKLDVSGAINATSLLVNGSPIGAAQWTTTGSNIYYNTGNVGIGTTTPSSKMHVYGNSSASQAWIQSTSSNIGMTLNGWYPGFGLNAYYDGSNWRQMGSSGFTGGFQMDPTDGKWLFMTGNSPGSGNVVSLASRMTIASNGNVGIATTNPTSGTLTVTGNISATTGLRISGTDVITSGRILQGANGSASAPAFSFSADTNTGMYSGTNDILRFTTGGTDKMSILANGNVGIGVASPAYKLDVQGGNALFNSVSLIGQSAHGASYAHFGATNRQNEGAYGILIENSTGNAGNNYYNIPALVSAQGAGHFFRAGNSTEIMTLRASGNIGIGTTAPGVRLDVSGSLRTNNSVTLSALAGGGSRMLTVDNGGVLGATTMPSSQWTTTGSNIYYNSGNVGIGTSAPSYKLDVAGDMRISASAFFDGGTFYKDQSGTPDSWWGMYAWEKELQFNKRTSANVFVQNIFTMDWDTGNFIMVPSSGNVGIGTTAPAEKLDVNGNVEADAYYYSSDLRFKKDIRTLDNSLEKINKLNPVSFNWISDGVASQGFIAQELELVLPELVKTNPQTSFKSVQYGNITAILVAGMKEQQVKIEKLELELELLKNKFSSLEK